MLFILFYIKLSVCCRTLDQSIYQIVKQIQWVDPSLAEIIIQLGGFHIVKTCNGVIGKRMKSSGFADILEASKVYKPALLEGICFYYINYKNTTILPN